MTMINVIDVIDVLNADMTYSRARAISQVITFVAFSLIYIAYIILSCVLDNKKFKSIDSEVLFTNKRHNRVEHFVYDTLIDLSNSKFVLMIDKEIEVILPALYTKKNNKISMINRNAEYTMYDHIESYDNTYSNEYTFIRACKLRDKKKGEQVLFVAVPNRETDILAYSDFAHKADKTVTFGKFRIFCFVDSEDNPYTDLFVDSEKVNLKKTKRKGMYFIGLDEVTKTNQKTKK